MAHKTPARSLIFSVGIVAAGIAIVYLAREVLMPIALALLLAFLLAPVTDNLRKLHLGKTFSSLLALLLTFIICGLLATAMARQFLDIAGDLPRYKGSISERLQAMSHLPAIGALTRGMETLTHGLANPGSAKQSPGHPAQEPLRTAKSPIPVQVVDGDQGNFAMARNVLTSLLGPLGQAGIVLVFATFILLHKEEVRNRFVRLAGMSQISVTTVALDDAGKRISRYLRFALLVNVCFGALIAAGLFALGMPNVLLWGMLAAAMRFVPYVGILISGSAPLLLSLAIFPGWLKPGLVLLLFFVLEAILSNAIEPVVYGANTGTSPLGLLVAAIAWTVLWGPVGLVLSTPLTVCLVVIGRHVPQLSFLHVLLAEEPALAHDAHLYQRLLAGDRDESLTIVNEALKDKPLVEVYDALVIPALRLAEQDRHKGAVLTDRAESMFSAMSQVIMEVETRIESGKDLSESFPKPSEENSLSFRPASECPQQIACLGVVDAADELCAEMLAQVLHHGGCNCVHFPSNWIHELREDTDDIIFLSAIPPFAFVSARSYCARIRRQCPSSTIIVGMWGHRSDVDKIKERFGTAKPDYVMTTFAEALDFVVAARLDHGSAST